MKIIFISGPYRGSCEWDVAQNIHRAEAVAIECWKRGWAVFCPHKNTAFFGGILPDTVWLDADLAILERCDAICMVPGWEKSSGAKAERYTAIKLGIPVYNDPGEVPKEGDPGGGRHVTELPSVKVSEED